MILLLTPNSLNPFHPRIKITKEILEKNGYKIFFHNLNSKTELNKINYFSLGFFNIVAFFKSISYILKYKKEVKVIYITDLQYLPISILAKIFNKKVIYETLDNNVELHFYNLSKKHQIIKNLKFLKSIFSFLEKLLVKNFCDEIIVNSKALNEYILPLKSNIIYYSSPFENKFIINYEQKEVIFLYLGLFSKDKGAEEILDFIKKYKIKGYIFGNIKEKELNEKIEDLKKENLIVYFPRLSPDELEKKLKDIFDKYRIIGVSLIKPVHFSYATQEANKDIDYMAMGIPIIGNYRIPTKEKIEKGCGVFFDKKEDIQKLIENKSFYKSLSLNAVDLYNKRYSQKIYKYKLIKIVKGLFR
ncbi:hypothetical protein [Nitrosophilus kaiyonis]|uniref:hypothetical protein n=1 Tax=Nitrosophilus kaiyonis TaxID=2930200 RepID=UPI0024928F68|nr:hypothetical protein [Nitrosophilus kaiyonis]